MKSTALKTIVPFFLGLFANANWFGLDTCSPLHRFSV